MSEDHLSVEDARPGELFDIYCEKILQRLYMGRGKREVALSAQGLALLFPDPLTGDEPEAERTIRVEAAWSAMVWLARHGYATKFIENGQDKNMRLCITPEGFALYGKTVPGTDPGIQMANFLTGRQ